MTFIPPAQISLVRNPGWRRDSPACELNLAYFPVETAVMLDEKDFRILTALDFHARDGLTDLAARLDMSKQLLEYRMKGLRKNGVLGGFYPVINSHRLGYFYGRLCVQCSVVSPALERDLRRYVEGHHQLFWAFAMGGAYDYLFVYWAHSVAQFEGFIADFMRRFGAAVRGRSEHIISNVVHLSHRCFIPNAPWRRFDLKDTGAICRLDELDQNILRALAGDARASYVKLAAQIKASEKVVRYRLRRLEDRQIIAGYRPVINYDRAGLMYFKVFLQLDFTQAGRFPTLEQYLIENRYTLYLVHGIGLPGDLDFELVIPSQAEFFAFMEQLRKSFPKVIIGYQYLLFSRLLKVNYFPFERGRSGARSRRVGRSV